jgi:hypothetical protein
MVRPRELGHVPDVLRVVGAPERPFGDRERLLRVPAVIRLLLGPLDPRLAVDRVPDDVDVRVAGVVALRLVRRQLGYRVGLRAPDHLQLRRRVRGQVADPQRRQAEPPERRVHLRGWPAVEDHVRPREGFSERGCGIRRALRPPRLRVGAVARPERVGLEERADVDRPAERGHGLAQRGEVRVSGSVRDPARVDRRAPGLRVHRQRQERDVAHRREEVGERAAPRVALSPADHLLDDGRVLAG